METIEKIKSILSEQLDTDSDDIHDASNVQEDLGADSLDIVDIIMAVEEEFDIEIPDDDVKSLKTVADIAAYVDSKAS
jgi:acyl carrier protein